MSPFSRIIIAVCLVTYVSAASDCSDHSNCGNHQGWMEENCGEPQLAGKCDIMCGNCPDFVTLPETTEIPPPTTPEPDNSCGGCEGGRPAQPTCTRMVRKAKRIVRNKFFAWVDETVEQKYCCDPYQTCAEECFLAAETEECGGCDPEQTGPQPPCSRTVRQEVQCRGKGRRKRGKKCYKNVQESYCCDGFRRACSWCIQED